MSARNLRHQPEELLLNLALHGKNRTVSSLHYGGPQGHRSRTALASKSKTSDFSIVGQKHRAPKPTSTFQKNIFWLTSQFPQLSMVVAASSLCLFLQPWARGYLFCCVVSFKKRQLWYFGDNMQNCAYSPCLFYHWACQRDNIPSNSSWRIPKPSSERGPQKSQASIKLRICSECLCLGTTQCGTAGTICRGIMG